MHDRDGEVRPLPQPVQSFSLEHYAGAFEPRSDLRFRLIDGLTVHDRSVLASAFSGTVLRDCRFVNVEFARSDLDGMRIERCHFAGCDLSRIDLRSSIVSNSEFTDSSLESADLLDTAFIETTFRNVSFTRTSTHGAHFERCTLSRSPLDGASWTLCALRDCVFDEMLLGDCTFMYNVMKGCTFTASSADVECIGMVYGLSRENMTSLRYLYDGEEQEIPDDADVIALLAALYAERRWGVGVMVMRLNFGLTSRVYAIREYFRWLTDGLAAEMVVKTEEIDFLGMLFRDLRASRALPLLNVAECIDVLNGPVAASIAHLSDTRAYELIGRFAGSLQGILVQMLDEFERERIRVPGRGAADRPLVVRATFDERPALPLSALLRDVALASGLPVGYESVTVETRAGSFIELVATSVVSVLGLQILLVLLNGCVIQATELKERVRRFMAPVAPLEYRALARQPRQITPQLAHSFEALSAYVLRQPWFGRYDLGGFSTDNFRALEGVRAGERRADPQP
jgi:hypothetical protein